MEKRQKVVDMKKLVIWSFDDTRITATKLLRIGNILLVNKSQSWIIRVINTKIHSTGKNIRNGGKSVEVLSERSIGLCNPIYAQTCVPIYLVPHGSSSFCCCRPWRERTSEAPSATAPTRKQMLLLKTWSGHHAHVSTAPGFLLRPKFVSVAPDAATIPGDRSRLGLPWNGFSTIAGKTHIHCQMFSIKYNVRKLVWT